MNRKVPILVQLILFFSIILLVILSATSYFAYRYSAQIVLQKTSRYLQESVVQLRGKIDVKLLEYDKLLQILMFSQDLQDRLIELNGGQSPKLSKYEIERYFARQGRYMENDVVIQLSDNTNDHYISTTTQSLLWRTEKELAANLPGYDLIAPGEGRMVWLSGQIWRNGHLPAVVGARQVNNWDTLEKLGNLYVAFPVEGLERMIGQINLGPTGNILIVDKLGRVVYSSGKDIKPGDEADGRLLSMLEKHRNSVFAWKDEGTVSYVSFSESEYSDWNVIAFVSRDELLMDLKKIERSILIIGAAGVLIALLFISFFSWTFSRPIRMLALRLQRLDKGFLTPYSVKFNNKEVHVLYESYNNMLRHLNETIKDLSDKQISEKQAQLIALKAQFRPHFLYNSLNTIYWTLVNEGQEKVARMVLALSDLLRYSIQPGSEMVTVEQDLKQLERYLDISKARYGNKLNATIEIDESILQCKMMKMLLQPLVENAITHGLESVKGRPWHIRIRITRHHELMHIVVEDNGVGMSEQKMREALIPRTDVDNHQLMHTGIGLSNLNYRIGLIYGKGYGISLSKSELGGLRVIIDVPLLYPGDNASKLEGDSHV